MTVERKVAVFHRERVWISKPVPQNYLYWDPRKRAAQEPPKPRPHPSGGHPEWPWVELTWCHFPYWIHLLVENLSLWRPQFLATEYVRLPSMPFQPFQKKALVKRRERKWHWGSRQGLPSTEQCGPRRLWCSAGTYCPASSVPPHSGAYLCYLPGIWKV